MVIVSVSALLAHTCRSSAIIRRRVISSISDVAYAKESTTAHAYVKKWTGGRVTGSNAAKIQLVTRLCPSMDYFAKFLCSSTDETSLREDHLITAAIAHYLYQHITHIQGLLVTCDKPGPPVIMVDFSRLPFGFTVDEMRPQERRGVSQWDMIEGSVDEIRLRVLLRVGGSKRKVTHMAFPHIFK